MRAQVIPYRYGLASEAGKGLICGHHGDPNPISGKGPQVLPFAKMFVGDAIYIHKRETWPAKIALAITSVKRHNKRLPVPIFAIIDSVEILEIVRIR